MRPRLKRPRVHRHSGEVLIEESLLLSELFGVPVTVRQVGDDKWAFLAGRETEWWAYQVTPETISKAKECMICAD